MRRSLLVWFCLILVSVSWGAAFGEEATTERAMTEQEILASAKAFVGRWVEYIDKNGLDLGCSDSRIVRRYGNAGFDVRRTESLVAPYLLKFEISLIEDGENKYPRDWITGLYSWDGGRWVLQSIKKHFHGESYGGRDIGLSDNCGGPSKETARKLAGGGLL